MGPGPGPGKISGGQHIGHMTRSLQYNCDTSYTGQCQMVRYRGGDQVSGGARYSDQVSGGPSGRRHRSRSRDRQRHKYNDTPVIADYLNSPMFDSLHHHKHSPTISLLRPKHSPTISLLSSRSAHHRKYGIGHLGGSGNKHSQPISIISQCKVL